MSIITGAIRGAVAAVARPYLEELADAIRGAQADRGAWVVRNFRREQPLLAGFAESFFAGTPEQALAAVSQFWPEFGQIPNAAAVVGEIQKLLREVRV